MTGNNYNDLHVTSVRVRGVNVEKPSAKAIENYRTLHEEGLI